MSGWLPRPNGSYGRESLLAVRSHPMLRVSPARHGLLGTVRRGRARPGRMLAAVGCSGELSQVLVKAAQSGGRLSTERSYAANRPAIALEMEPAKEARLTLYVSPRTYRPLVAFAYVEGQQVTARLYLARITRNWLRRFHLPEKRRPTPR